MTLVVGNSTSASTAATRHRIEARGGKLARSRLVSDFASPRFEFVRHESLAQSGPERLYRSSRAWFTPAAFKRRIGFDVPVFGCLGMSYVPASQPSGARGLGGC